MFPTTMPARACFRVALLFPELSVVYVLPDVDTRLVKVQESRKGNIRELERA